MSVKSLSPDTSNKLQPAMKQYNSAQRKKKASKKQNKLYNHEAVGGEENSKRKMNDLRASLHVLRKSLAKLNTNQNPNSNTTTTTTTNARPPKVEYSSRKQNLKYNKPSVTLDPESADFVSTKLQKMKQELSWKAPHHKSKSRTKGKKYPQQGNSYPQQYHTPVQFPTTNRQPLYMQSPSLYEHDYNKDYYPNFPSAPSSTAGTVNFGSPMGSPYAPMQFSDHLPPALSLNSNVYGGGFPEMYSHYPNGMRQNDMRRNQVPSTIPEAPKRKSKICRHFVRGYCKLGNACNFSHELQTSIPADQIVFLGGLPTGITGEMLVDELKTQYGLTPTDRPTIISNFAPRVGFHTPADAKMLIRMKKIRIFGQDVDVRPFVDNNKTEAENAMVFLGGLPENIRINDLLCQLKESGYEAVNRPNLGQGYARNVQLENPQKANDLIRKGTIVLFNTTVDVRPYVNIYADEK